MIVVDADLVTVGIGHEEGVVVCARGDCGHVEAGVEESRVGLMEVLDHEVEGCLSPRRLSGEQQEMCSASEFENGDVVADLHGPHPEHRVELERAVRVSHGETDVADPDPWSLCCHTRSVDHTRL